MRKFHVRFQDAAALLFVGAVSAVSLVYVSEADDRAMAREIARAQFALDCVRLDQEADALLAVANAAPITAAANQRSYQRGLLKIAASKCAEVRLGR